MNTHIYITPQTMTHFFSPDSSRETSINHSRSVIVNYSHFSVNEANIAHSIRQIPYYTNYFTILEDYDAIDVSEMSEHVVKPISSSSQYFLFRYSDKHSVPLLDTIYQFTDIKSLLASTMDSFIHIVTALHLLSQQEICMFNLTPRNILYLEDYKGKPVLAHFRYSLRLNKLTYDYISHILEKLEDFTYLPLEVHILYYFVKHHLTTISYAFIEEVCEEFMESQPVLRLFPETFRQQYREQCLTMMRTYVNQPRKQILDDLLERSNTWDVYAVSVIYVHLFGCIERVFSLEGTFIQAITMELAKNLHPDAHQRMTLEQTLCQYHTLLDKQKSWQFVRTLDNAKMSLLMTELSS